MQEYRRIAGQVIGEQQARSLRGEGDLRHPRARCFDREHDATSQRVAVEPDVGLDVTAGHVEHVERLDGHLVILPAARTGYGAGPQRNVAVTWWPRCCSRHASVSWRAARALRLIERDDVGLRSI